MQRVYVLDFHLISAGGIVWSLWATMQKLTCPPPTSFCRFILSCQLKAVGLYVKEETQRARTRLDPDRALWVVYTTFTLQLWVWPGFSPSSVHMHDWAGLSKTGRAVLGWMHRMSKECPIWGKVLPHQTRNLGELHRGTLQVPFPSDTV